MTKKTTTKKTTTKKKVTKKTTKKNVSISINDYGITMLEIPTKERSVWISMKKALAILDTNDDPSLIKTVEKYGKELFKINYPDGKTFTVGQAKIEAVLNNDAKILKALQQETALRETA